MKGAKKRKAIFMPPELYERIKAAAKQNNRKILDEIRNRFNRPKITRELK